MNWPAYPQYKDSGVAWLGDIPNSWVMSPLKFHLERNDGGVWGDDPDGVADTIVLRSTEQTVDGNWVIDDPAPRKLSSGEARAARLVEDDLLVTKSSGSSLHIGKTTIVSAKVAELQCCYSNFMQRLRTADTLRPRYAWYLMNHRIMREQFDLYSNSTTGLANLSATILGAARLALPPVDQQDSILRFLDAETAKVDALMEKQEQLIATLREDRTSTITQAVTKGLDPDIAMRDSGVEWIGSVPAHWPITKLAWHATCRSGEALSSETIEASPDEQHTVPVVGGNGTMGYAGVINLSEPALVIGRVGALCGNVHSVEEPAWVTDNALLLKIHRGGFVRGYLWRLLGARNLNDIAAKTAQPLITGTQVSSQRLPLPPEQEQQAIVAFLNSRCSNIDALIAKANEVIETMREYRSALITDAVTGKIDVRDVA
ncbi:restriction endonuclease subunit S [Rhodococcus opacus]|uniref:restriction endonuclease subunit S n=1 Tax=Rhodococcus opacus TaxID=37919 RepID=UPI00155A8E39|nr:restriction endonuclease subunit S [Rhodococcus opacus]